VALRAELSSRWLDDRLEISPSIRFERYSGFDAEWIPGLFVEGRPLEWLVLKASASRSYRIPSFQELYLPDKGFERGNEDLEPEEAWNFEVGSVLSSPFDVPWLEGEIEATFFAGEVEDSIAFTLISTSVVAPVNIGRSSIRGYELTLRWRPHPWLRLIAARTVTDARRDVNDKNVVGIAVSQIDGRLELGPQERFKLVGEVHYTGRIPQNQGGTADLASRVAFDASASVDLARIEALGLGRFTKSLWLSFRGRNLGNVAMRDTLYRPRPGRNFSLALEGVF
jgi:iron complex outermembrane receptor protein